MIRIYRKSENQYQIQFASGDVREVWREDDMIFSDIIPVRKKISGEEISPADAPEWVLDEVPANLKTERR